MSNGFEILLAVRGKNAEKMLNEIGISANFGNENDEDYFDNLNDLIDKIDNNIVNEQLLEVFKAALTEKFGNDTKFYDVNWYSIEVETLTFKKVFAFWSLDFRYEHDLDSEPILGIKLTNSFLPTFLDWDSNGNDYFIELNDEAMSMVALARKHLEAVNPCFKDLALIVRLGD